MSFWAKSFVFDGIPSETYDLFLISNGGAGVIENSGSNSVELYTQTVYRNPKPYLFGTQQSNVLTFTLSFASLKPISALKQQVIQKWLFGHNTYKKLQIMQCDMDNVYFNCILNNPTVTTVGNYAYYMTCDVVCDAPWAWEFPKKYSYGPFTVEGSFVHNNTSDNNYYTMPKITVQISDYGNTFQITNITDNNSSCGFTNLSPSEILTIDSERAIIKSSTGLLRVGNMTGTMPRLLPGVNIIKIIGSISNITIEYQNARKVSG